MSRFLRGTVLRQVNIFVACVWAGLQGVVLACQSPQEVKFEQYYVQGERLYEQHCANCHHKDGAGLRQLYPPLNNSDFMKEEFTRVVCLMKFGMEGEVTVNGKVFNQPMPGVATLTHLELAEIATYIYNTWDHERGLVEVDHVAAALEKCP